MMFLLLCVFQKLQIAFLEHFNGTGFGYTMSHPTVNSEIFAIILFARMR